MERILKEQKWTPRMFTGDNPAKWDEIIKYVKSIGSRIYHDDEIAGMLFDCESEDDVNECCFDYIMECIDDTVDAVVMYYLILIFMDDNDGREIIRMSDSSDELEDSIKTEIANMVVDYLFDYITKMQKRKG